MTQPQTSPMSSRAEISITLRTKEKVERVKKPTRQMQRLSIAALETYSFRYLTSERRIPKKSRIKGTIFTHI
jgi:hypothetical protein